MLGKGYINTLHTFNCYLRPYRHEHTASRPIREVKHGRGQRVLPWVTRREHCAAAGFFLSSRRKVPYSVLHTHRCGYTLFLHSTCTSKSCWVHGGMLPHFTFSSHQCQCWTRVALSVVSQLRGGGPFQNHQLGVKSAKS